ncbi:MAG: hypothetical protein LBS50_05025 [Prevotellaceae bacterium]|jgi:hypothetical protein|nr:hypothetical protein [Prevotellaceae bacterium]
MLSLFKFFWIEQNKEIVITNWNALKKNDDISFDSFLWGDNDSQQLYT